MGQLIFRCQHPRSTTTAAPAMPVVIRPTGQNQRGIPLRGFFSLSLPCSATATLDLSSNPHHITFRRIFILPKLATLELFPKLEITARLAAGRSFPPIAAKLLSHHVMMA